MALIPRSWMLNRLRGRLNKVQRAKDEAMQALVVRDEGAPHTRPRHQFQDPGQVGSMLDEIAELKQQIAGLEGDDETGYTSITPPARPAPAVPVADLSPAPGGGALDAAFERLRAELSLIQRASPGTKIGVEELRQALQTALWSPEVLDAAFSTLRGQMTQMQRVNLPGRIGLNALRDALRISLAGSGGAEAANWNGHWPDVPGVPLNAEQDGWHWVRAPGKPLVVLSWHAETRAWGHRVGISPQKVAADGVRYFGPCIPPMAMDEAGKTQAVEETLPV